jgi:hypothetical protein
MASKNSLLKNIVKKIIPTTKGRDVQVIDLRVNPETGKPFIPPINTPKVNKRPFKYLPTIPDVAPDRKVKQRYRASRILES